MENKNVDQVRRLTQGVFLSGALNIVLLALFFYWLVREVPPRPYCELKPAEQQEEQIPLAINHGNAEIIRSFRELLLDQLVAKLNDTQLVENGYTQRDLALAALFAFHHFDISRALLGQAQPSQMRMMPYAKNRDGALMEVVVYPGMSDPQFQAIIHYAHTERWPLTSQGLFQLLRKQKGQYDTTLADAFFLTPEFLAVEMLFNRSEKNVEKKDLLSVLSQGDWKLLSSFVEQQRLVQDLSPARRQRFLNDYIDRESRAAAYLMLKTDGAFALRKLDDEHVIAVLKLLVVKTPETEQFAIALLDSPRSDAVLTAAGQKLFDFAGEPIPEKDVYQAARARFSQQKHAEMVAAPQAPAALPPAVAPTKVSKSVPLKQSKPPLAPLMKKEKKAVAQTQTSLIPTKKTPPATKKAVLPRRSKMYVVADGDSLWKIAKRFNVEVEVLRKVNRLKSDSLKPGTPLLIP